MIEFNDSQIQKTETLLGGIKDAIPKAQTRAINRSLTTAQSVIVKAVPKEYIVDKETVKNSIKLTQATYVRPIGYVRSAGGVIPLSKFAVAREFVGKKAAVKAQVKRAGSYKPIKGAFVAQMKEIGFGNDRRSAEGDGHIGVYKRLGKTRLPIRQIYGPSIPQMIGSSNVIKQIEEKALDTLDKRLDHEINRILEGQV